MSDTIQYKKPTCTNINFGQVPDLTKLPFKTICDPVPPLFNEKNPETYFGFATSCVESYGAGTFLINGLDSGKVFEGVFTGKQMIDGEGLSPGVYTFDGKIVRVERALAIPGSYQTAAAVPNATFIAKGHPAIIQKIYLNSVDPTLELNSLPASAIPTATDLVRNGKEPNTIWIASPLSINITKPATVLDKSDTNTDFVSVRIQLDNSGAATFDIDAIKSTSECYPAGTRGFCILQSSDITDCVDNRPIWTFIPLDLNQALLVSNQETAVPAGTEADFVVGTGTNEGVHRLQRAKAIQEFKCPHQLGIAFLQDCEWVAVPYAVEQLNANLRAISTECSLTNVIKVKTAGQPDASAQTVLRGDVVEGNDQIQAIPAGTPGLLLSTPEENCGTSLVKFFPFPVIGTVVVQALTDLAASDTSGKFAIYDGLAPGDPNSPDNLNALVAADSGMCRGDLAILNVGDNCNLYVTPVNKATTERVIPAIVTEETSSKDVKLRIYEYDPGTGDLVQKDIDAIRADITEINANTTADCVKPFLPVGTKGIVRVIRSCSGDGQRLFYPTEKTSFFVGVPAEKVAFKDDPTEFVSAPDSSCNIDAGIKTGFAIVATPTKDVLCPGTKSIVYFDEQLGEWVATPMSEDLPIVSLQTRTYRARALGTLECGGNVDIEFLNEGVWNKAKCPTKATCEGCVPEGSYGTYRVTFSSETLTLKKLREAILPYANLPALNVITWNDIKTALKALANDDVFPGCELKVERDDADTLNCPSDSEFIPNPTFIAQGISQDAYHVGSTGKAQLINWSSDGEKGTTVDFSVEHETAKDEHLLLIYDKVGSACKWKQISAAIEGLIVVDTNACLNKDNGSDLKIRVTPVVNLPSAKWSIKKGVNITVDIDSFSLDFLSNEDICIPEHCGGTALFDVAADKWYYTPSIEAATITTVSTPAEVTRCNGTSEFVEVAFVTTDKTGVKQNTTDSFQTSQFNIPKGTPGVIRKYIKKLCSFETALKAEFVPSTISTIPVYADVAIDKGKEHKFVVDRASNYGAPPAAVNNAQPSIYENPQILTGSLIDTSDMLLATADDDFCPGDKGLAVQDGCVWKVTRTTVRERTMFHSGSIISVTDQQNVTNAPNALPTQIDSMIFGQKCRTFTDFDPVAEEADNISNIHRGADQKFILPGQKVRIDPSIKEKVCDTTIPQDAKYPDHNTPIEAYSLATGYVGDQCMYWNVRINCTEYWLCMPMQSTQTLITIVEQQNKVTPDDCASCGDGHLKSIDRDFLNPITGTKDIYVSCGKYRSTANKGDRFIAALSKSRSGGGSWNTNGLKLNWSLMELPPINLYAHVCWHVEDQDPGSETFNTRYHKATLCDVTGELIRDENGDPQIIGVRLSKVLPTKIGTNAIYLIKEEQEVANSIVPDHVHRFFELVEDSKRGVVPDAYRAGVIAQNAPSPTTPPAGVLPIPDRRHIIGKPIDKSKAYIDVDLKMNNTAADECPQQRLCFVANENWGTEPAEANWKWGRVLAVIGEDNPTKPIAAHEIGPYSGIIQLQMQPDITGDTIVDLTAGARLYAVWKETIMGENVTYAELLKV